MRGASDPRRFQVAESSSLRLLWLLVPMFAAMAISIYAHLQTTRSNAPWMEITLSPPYFTMGGSAAWTLLILAALSLILSWAFFRRRIELAGDVLDVRSTLYRRRTPVSALQLDQAELVDLKHDRRYAIHLKTNGYQMPGFYSGHFRLHGGRKAFALVTDKQRVLAIPVNGGPTLLLSLEQPQSLLDALRRTNSR